ncbi:MAG TPA: LysM peptidoglycan-binding domain-containing protein [Clostridia bacterium]|nr:LysM peptidoglycan-binding domain-containing protein [Clostridia bacterium]
MKIAVFLVLAIHGIGLFALLMQGCNKAPEPQEPLAAQEEIPTNSIPEFADTANMPPVDTNTPVDTTYSNAPTMATAPVTSAPPTYVDPTASLPNPGTTTQPPSTAPTTSMGMANEYKVAKGDTLAGIAKKNHVSLKAIQDANPGIEPTRLKIGQTIRIPAGGTSSPVASSSSSFRSGTGSESLSGSQTYTVKSGDSLTRIARQQGVSIKALRAANNLKTDRIVVGQKLKLPAKTGSTSSAASAPATTTEPPPSTLYSPGVPAGQ